MPIIEHRARNGTVYEMRIFCLANRVDIGGNQGPAGLVAFDAVTPEASRPASLRPRR